MLKCSIKELKNIIQMFGYLTQDGKEETQALEKESPIHYQSKFLML